MRLVAPPGDTDGCRTVVAVRSRGCILLRQGRGCVHCGLTRPDIWSPTMTTSHMVAQFRHDLAARESLCFSTLCLYTAGSFLDDTELPPTARRAILKAAGRRPSIRRVILESRPEFVTVERLAEVQELLGERVIEVGLGLESVHTTVRNQIVGKRTSLASYRRAIAQLHRADAKAIVYVLVKPPGLSEGAALEDAWQTVQAAFAMKADAVSLEPVAVQPEAPLAALYRRGEYRPPWLWTLVELARRAAPLGEVRIGGNVVVPEPIAAARNCGRCTPRVWRALREFERTQDAGPLCRLRCSCRVRWEAEVRSAATAPIAP